MSEFWDEMFQKIGLLWQFEPADSAIYACNLFARNGLRKILIPGVGYGRNAQLFVEQGFEVTGIEISKTAIQLAHENGLVFPIHHGSVAQMPFDNSVYDGIYCYALVHLLNQKERRQFLKNCFNQLKSGGIMIFVVVSKHYKKLYNSGALISKDRFRMNRGLNVLFYDEVSIENEFGKFDLLEYCEINEPVKHLENEEPMKFYQIICRKS